MTFGGSPAHGVWMMTCTSLMSGSASSGTRRMHHKQQQQQSRSMKTRNGLRAHHAMMREIITCSGSA